MNDQIDKQLFERIGKKLKLERAATYNKINGVADELNVPKWVAAVKLASTLGIGIGRYATPDYYSYLKPGGASAAAHPAQITQPSQPKSRVIERPQLVNFDTSRLPNPELRKIIQRDVSELNVAIAAGYDKTAKTCMVLAGSITEALLLERLTRDPKTEAGAVAVSQGLTNPPKRLNPLSWDLATLVNVALSMSPPFLPADSMEQVGQLRQWRNLIHPGRELKSLKKDRVEPTPQRAKNAVGFLEFVAHELAKP